MWGRGVEQIRRQNKSGKVQREYLIAKRTILL